MNAILNKDEAMLLIDRCQKLSCIFTIYLIVECVDQNIFIVNDLCIIEKSYKKESGIDWLDIKKTTGE